jgi:glycyl-tRNA synthetase alpha chain
VAKTLQEIILALQQFWAQKGCLITQPYNSEVGAATFNPSTFLRVLDKKPWNACYVEPSKRPRDGRYGKNPLRVQQYLQFQVILKPAPDNSQDLYLESLKAIGVNLEEHDIRFVEDDWESPTLGASGLGWQVDLDGIEITQFTYFQQIGGLELPVIPVELTYGLERIAMFLQNIDHFFDVKWNQTMTWGDVYGDNEKQFSAFNFEEADVELHKKLFDQLEKEAKRLFQKGLVYPGYDCVIKCSHIFNLLEARGAISVSERTNYIGRVRAIARQAALAYLSQNNEVTTDEHR